MSPAIDSLLPGGGEGDACVGLCSAFRQTEAEGRERFLHLLLLSCVQLKMITCLSCVFRGGCVRLPITWQHLSKGQESIHRGPCDRAGVWRFLLCTLASLVSGPAPAPCRPGFCHCPTHRISLLLLGSSSSGSARLPARGPACPPHGFLCGFSGFI